MLHSLPPSLPLSLSLNGSVLLASMPNWNKAQCLHTRKITEYWKNSRNFPYINLKKEVKDDGDTKHCLDHRPYHKVAVEHQLHGWYSSCYLKASSKWQCIPPFSQAPSKFGQWGFPSLNTEKQTQAWHEIQPQSALIWMDWCEYTFKRTKVIWIWTICISKHG